MDLLSQFSGGGQNHGEGLALPESALVAEARHHWETKGQGLSRPSKVSYNQVFFVVDSPERAILHGEKLSDAAGCKALHGGTVKLREVGEVAKIVSSARVCRLLR